MKLEFPLKGDLKFWKTRKFMPIMATALTVSAYYLIGMCSSGTDFYIAFTNEKQDQIWIEKTTSLLGQASSYASSFQKIETDEEFNLAYDFFIKKGVLDG